MPNPLLYAHCPGWLRLWALTALGVMAPALAVTASAADAPCGACVAVAIAPGQALALPAQLNGLTVLVRVPGGEARAAVAALESIAARGGRPGLLLDGVPVQPLDRDAVRRSDVLVIDTNGVPLSAGVVFNLKQRITEARGVHPDVTVGIAAQRQPVADLDPYVDFLLSAEASPKPTWRTLDAGSTIIDVLLGDTLRGGADKWLWSAPPDVAAVTRMAGDLARAARWLPPGMIASPTVRVTCGGIGVPAYLNPRTLETVAIAAACGAGAPIGADPAEPGIERLDLSGGATLIRVPAPGSSDRFAEAVQVLGARSLSVEEIVARHQAASARQVAAVHSAISAGNLTLTFEAPGFPAPITIGSQTVIYSAGGRTDLEQREVRVNAVAFHGGGVPRLPIIEPERVAAPPLTITLTSVYRYRLDGRETIGRTSCYVVAFDPIDARAPLFRGRAWIAADDFGMVKVAAVQTGLRGPIVASEQTDEFARQGEGLWLLARSDTRQMYEGAAHRTPIHRVLVLESHEINAADFESRRSAAYASDAVMLRDTPEGYRYLKRERPKAGAPIGAVEPVVAARADRVRTLAAGVLIDPNISEPLPFAGFSYVDFDLFGTGTQVNAFFGGTYGQLAFSVPSVGGSRWQVAGRAFGIASSYNDREFRQGIELYDEDIRQRPAQASVWLLRPLSARVSMRIGYDLEYTRFSAGDATAGAFTVPANQVVHGLRVALDAQREGWNASVWWNPARRSGWRAWGLAGDFRADQRDFQRYGATVARAAVIKPGLVGRLEGAVMSGRDLDRFSRYSFGTFDNRLHGYPSALIRYDRGGVLRGTLAWAAGRFVRLDVFADSALVRDPGFGRGLRNYTGLGTAVEAPAPFGTLVAVEWGYGLRGVNATGHIGTQVIRVTGYKVF